MPDEPKAPEEGQPPKEPEAPKEPIEFKIPEKFEGKSAEEIAQAYVELSKTIGKQGEELGKTKKELEDERKNLENWKKLGAVIENDPEIYDSLKKKLGAEPDKEQNGKTTVDESKLFIRDNIIDKFEESKGIKSLEPDKAEALRKAVGGQLQMMLDPYGTGKDLNDLMLEIPLNRLPMYFENAYKLATAENAEEQARLRGLAQANSNANGMLGSMPSSSANTRETVLTDKQKEAAKKLGIQEKDYIEYLNKQ